MKNSKNEICTRLDVLITLTQGIHDAQQAKKIERLLDIQDVLVLLGISIATYYRLVQRGELLPRRRGKRHYYYLSDLTIQQEKYKRKGKT